MPNRCHPTPPTPPQPTLLINFLIFFHPGHSYSNPPPSPQPRKTFWNNTIMLTFLQSCKRNRLICIVFWFVSLCKEANTLCFVYYICIKKSTYCQLLTSVHMINRMSVDVILLNVILLILFFRMKLMKLMKLSLSIKNQFLIF